MLENLSQFFEKTNLEYDEIWLQNHQNILHQYKHYHEDLYKGCNELLDLFCMQTIREIVSDISNDYEFDLDEKIFDFIEIIHNAKIDFNVLVLMGGEEYLQSDVYSYEHTCENNQFNIVRYLIVTRYDEIVEIFVQHYGNGNTFFLALLEAMGLRESYEEVMQQIANGEETSENETVEKLQKLKENSFALDFYIEQ